MITAKILSGEADFASLYPTLQNYPLYKENADKGGYRVLLWPSALGGEWNYHFNQTYNEDLILREMFRDVRFRRALSLAINRYLKLMGHVKHAIESDIYHPCDPDHWGCSEQYCGYYQICHKEW